MAYVAGASDRLALSVRLRRKRPTVLLRPSGERVMGECGLGAGLHSQTVGHIEGCLRFYGQGDHHSPVHEREEDVLSVLMRLRRSRLFVLLV